MHIILGLILLILAIILFLFAFGAYIRSMEEDDSKKTTKPADPPKPDTQTPDPATNQNKSSLWQNLRNFFQNASQNIQNYPIIGAFILYYPTRIIMGKDYANKMMADFFQKNP